MMNNNHTGDKKSVFPDSASGSDVDQNDNPYATQ